MSHNTIVSNIIGALKVIISGAILPVLVVAITAGALSSLPAGAVSSESLSLMPSPDHTLVVDNSSDTELSPRWTQGQETISFDHMYGTH